MSDYLGFHREKRRLELAFKADEIDGALTDPAATVVRIDASVSSTAAVHARGCLEAAIERMDPDGSEMWASWPLRRLVNVLSDALGDGA